MAKPFKTADGVEIKRSMNVYHSYELQTTFSVAGYGIEKKNGESVYLSGGKIKHARPQFIYADRNQAVEEAKGRVQEEINCLQEQILELRRQKDSIE